MVRPSGPCCASEAESSSAAWFLYPADYRFWRKVDRYLSGRCAIGLVSNVLVQLYQTSQPMSPSLLTTCLKLTAILLVSAFCCSSSSRWTAGTWSPSTRPLSLSRAWKWARKQLELCLVVASLKSFCPVPSHFSPSIVLAADSLSWLVVPGIMSYRKLRRNYSLDV